MPTPPKHITFCQQSKSDWGLGEDKIPSTEQLIFGAIQRIANAAERTAESMSRIETQLRVNVENAKALKKTKSENVRLKKLLKDMKNL